MAEYVGEPVQVQYTEPGSHRFPSLDSIEKDFSEAYGMIELECVDIFGAYHAPGCGAGHVEIWRAKPVENLSGRDIARHLE